MAPGPRRRTPGLRREEVAQLSGVGVTWYTWLEQGRPINASRQVLDAVARTLRLDGTEREHLYHLAEVPHEPEPESGADAEGVGPEVQAVLDALDPLSAAVYNERFDVLAVNAPHRRNFDLMAGRSGPPNMLEYLLLVPESERAVKGLRAQLPMMVAMMRGSYGRHVGEPVWEAFVQHLLAVSAPFGEMWRSGNVAPSGSPVESLRHDAVGLLRMKSVSLAIQGRPDLRIVVCSPADEESRKRVGILRAGRV
jgi:transcriptional regulator with XRE-family HTH domain